MVGDAMVILLVLVSRLMVDPRTQADPSGRPETIGSPSGLPEAIGSPCLKMPILFGEGRSLSKVLDGGKLPPLAGGLEGARATQR